MSGYPVIYWVVVAIVAGAVSTVLIGVGYLLGLNLAARRVAALRDELSQRHDLPTYSSERADRLAARYDDLVNMARNQGGL